MSRLAWLAVCAMTSALACGHAAAPLPPTPAPARHAPPDAAIDAPPPLDQDLPRLAARAVQLYQDWRRALEQAGQDCAAATAAVDAVATKYTDVIAANQRIVRAGHDKVQALRAALAPHQAELDEAARAIVQSPAMAACHADAAFAAAIDRISGPP